MVLKMRLVGLMLLGMMLGGCVPSPENERHADVLPPIYPDYEGVVMPCNIAPLNFLLRDSYEANYTVVSNGTQSLTSHRRGNEVLFDIGKWKKLISESVGKRLSVTVSSLANGQWTQYKPFTITVSPDSIDIYLTYRLIEPDYEVFSRLSIVERNVTDFYERVICDWNSVGNRCMNCHTNAPGQNDLSFMYVRGEGGGMVLNNRGMTELLDIKTSDMVSGPVYAQFDPSGRFLVFSTNAIIPAFHSHPEKRLEVFDTKSDVYAYDLKNRRLISSRLVADSVNLETFPAFGADGRSVYFCAAKGPVRPSHLDSLHYSLCRIDFNPETGKFGERVDTLVAGGEGRGSVSHPRVSPDGRFLLYCTANFGTFPIWHREADLRMMDLETGDIANLEIVNSDMSDTYHTWSSSGRWFVFASKRDDGLYGKPYFVHVSEDGTVSKPVLLPQKSPSFYDYNLKSFNVPDFGTAPATINPQSVIGQ